MGADPSPFPTWPCLSAGQFKGRGWGCRLATSASLSGSRPTLPPARDQN